MLIDLPSRRHGRRRATDLAILALLHHGLRVCEMDVGGRLQAVHLGDGDQLLRSPVPPAPQAHIAFDECPTFIGVDLASGPDLTAEWTVADLKRAE